MLLWQILDQLSHLPSTSKKRSADKDLRLGSHRHKLGLGYVGTTEGKVWSSGTSVRDRGNLDRKGCCARLYRLAQLWPQTVPVSSLTWRPGTGLFKLVN